MDESIKYRIVGFGVIIAMALVCLPFLFKGNKPDWLIVESSKSFKIPTSPKLIHFAIKKPQKKWLKSMKEIVIDVDKKSDKVIEVVQSEFSVPQSKVGFKPKITHKVQIIELKTALKPKLIASNKNVEKSINIKLARQKGSLNQPLKKQINANLNIHKSKERVNKYSLQLITFLNSRYANRMLKKIKQYGTNAHVSKISSNSTLFYTLFVNEDFTDLAKLKLLQKKLDLALNLKSLIIKQNLRKR